MAIDLSSSETIFKGLVNHVGHKVVCVDYGSRGKMWNVSLECETCSEVILEADAPEELNTPLPGGDKIRFPVSVTVQVKKAKTALFGCKECGRLFENHRQLNGHMSAHRK